MNCTNPNIFFQDFGILTNICPPKQQPSENVIFKFLLLFFAMSLLLFRKFGVSKEETMNIDIAKPKRKIPYASHFPHLPQIVNGFYTLYRVQSRGLEAFGELTSKWGNFFELPLATGSVYACCDPAIAQKILQSTNPKHLEKPRHLYDIIFVDAFRDGLVSSDVPLWSTHRKILNRCFTYSSLQSYLPLMNEHGKGLVAKLQLLCDNPEKSVRGTPMYELIWSETIKIITRALMGEAVFSDEDTHKIHHNFKRAKIAVQHRMLRPELLINPIWKFHPLKKELDDSIKILREMGMRVINEYKLNRMNKTEEEISVDPRTLQKRDTLIRKVKCLVEEMLDAGASDKEIFDEYATFVSTGHETNTLAINTLMFYLAAYPECQQKCREEIDSVLLNKLSAYDLSMDDLSNLKYLERCILETLRVTTTTPVFIRQLNAPLKIDDDLELKANSTVLFSPWSIHRNPDIYPEPERFDPDRFLPENVKARHPCAYLPFSAGPRNCIGFKYAIMEVKTIVSWLLRWFEFETNDRPENIKYFLELTLMPEKEFDVFLRRRKDI